MGQQAVERPASRAAGHPGLSPVPMNRPAFPGIDRQLHCHNCHCHNYTVTITLPGNRLLMLNTHSSNHQVRQ
jgi:6-pyruvoyl-tetrahydropterin synthase